MPVSSSSASASAVAVGSSEQKTGLGVPYARYGVGRFRILGSAFEFFGWGGVRRFVILLLWF